MNFGPRFFSHWFLITLVFTNISSRAEEQPKAESTAVAKTSCPERLEKTNLPAAPTRQFYLTDFDRSLIGDSFINVSMTDSQRFERARNIYVHARLAGMKPEHAEMVRSFDFNMRGESFYGVRHDPLLKALVERPGLNSVAILLVDAVHEIESRILNLEFTGKIQPRAGFKVSSLPEIYRDEVIRAEHEMLSLLSKVYAKAEFMRISGLLRKDKELREFAGRLLAAPNLTFKQYRRMQNPRFFGNARQITWRVIDDHARASADENRQALWRLLTTWTRVDRKVHIIQDTALNRVGLAQASGERPTEAEVELAAHTNALRRVELTKEWEALHRWEDRRREASLIMLQFWDFNPKFNERVQIAIANSKLPLEDYLKVRANRDRLTAPWCK